jgi:phosphonate transport system substrate-binding protein
MVCPHDTVHKPERWYRLEQYLIQRLGIEMQFTISLDATDFQENLGSADIVYTNPSDKFAILANKGFVSVARPADKYDEAVFVAHPDITDTSMEALRGAEIISVTSLIPTKIARHVLQSNGIEMGTIHAKDSWLSVISGVWNQEANFGIVYKDTYDNLSEQGKGMVNLVTATSEQQAFHTIDIGPKLIDRQDEITQLFLNMHTDEQGKQVLAELEVPQWLPVTPEELSAMERLMQL